MTLTDLKERIDRELIGMTWLRKPDWLLDLAWAWGQREPRIIPNLGQGTYEDAMNFTIEAYEGTVKCEAFTVVEFITAWFYGSGRDYPEYVTWLEKRYGS